MTFRKLLVLGVCVLGVTLATAQTPRNESPHVLMISIDGMRPDYVSKADEHHLKVENLRKFLADGTYAEGVVGIVPTVTFPSHTTLITGVWPASHGIVNNTFFDPLGEHPNEWYWYFKDLKAETLYQAADKSGLTTASVGWPVTVGAPIDYLIVSVGSNEASTPQRDLLHPIDVKEKIGVEVSKGSSIDEDRALWTQGIIRRYNPNFILVHFLFLDHVEHEYGPFSPEANEMLEKIDKLVGSVISTERALDPSSKVVIVSDHGFAAVNHLVHVNMLLAKAGLIHLSQEKAVNGKLRIESWDAEAWSAGGNAAIVLKDPQNTEVLRKVNAVLEKMQADPKFGVNRIVSHHEIATRGGFPTATFLVDFKPGWSSAGGMEGAEVDDLPHTVGTHGYWPDDLEMRSVFMCDGKGIAQHRNLGVIDMRQIAPSVAEMLGVTLSAARQKPVHYKP